MATTSIQQTQFITLAIGATAQRMGITATELHNRLKQHGLVRRLLIDCYDTLHAESIDGVVWNVQEALKNWEARTMRDQVLWCKEGRISLCLLTASALTLSVR